MATVPPADESSSALYADDLALARACEAGDEAAWERFVRDYQPLLQRAAQAIDPTGGARESADALFGDLYAKKLFRYFQGRSRLGTWLRAVLAQRYVDRLRELKRTEPLPETHGDWPAAVQATAEHQQFVTKVREALTEAIAALEPRDRLRLRCYYIDGMKLAAIGRLLREHAATASRNLERTRGDLRAAVEKTVGAECIDAVLQDPGNIDIGELMGPSTSSGQDPDRARSGPRIVQTKKGEL